VSAFALPPRFHNVLSYSGAFLVLPILLDWSRAGALLPAAMWCAHFLRRTAESLWVHRYSGRPVPPADYLVEYTYYWGFAAWIAWGLSAAEWGLPSLGTQIMGGGIFLGGECGNAWSHLYLRSLRADQGSQEKQLPARGLFSWVACPHYLFEIISWIGFAILTQVWGSVAFLLVGAGILSSYAWARHQAYRKVFDGLDGRELYPKKRRALVPLIF
jgi:very-long-chain enoyl-CoA reductase